MIDSQLPYHSYQMEMAVKSDRRNLQSDIISHRRTVLASRVELLSWKLGNGEEPGLETATIGGRHCREKGGVGKVTPAAP